MPTPCLSCIGDSTRVNGRKTAPVCRPSQAYMLALHRAAEDNDLTPHSRAQELWSNASVSRS